MIFTPKDAVVWSEIRVSNLKQATAFYAEVLQNGMQITTDMGPEPMAMFGYAGDPGVAGHLVQGKPAPAGTGNVIHLVVPDTLEATRTRLTAAGGTVQSPDIEIPSGAYFYATDPDGNTIGLFAFKD